jgi:hypothetical protein
LNKSAAQKFILCGPGTLFPGLSLLGAASLGYAIKFFIALIAFVQEDLASGCFGDFT